jgi:hypothetical protein
LARCTGVGTLEGIYHHWDSYPIDGPGQFLIRILTGHFQNDLAWMLRFLIDEHPAGRAICPAMLPTRTHILDNGLHDRCRHQTIPGNAPTKPIYKGPDFVANLCI